MKTIVICLVFLLFISNAVANDKIVGTEKPSQGVVVDKTSDSPQLSWNATDLRHSKKDICEVSGTVVGNKATVVHIIITRGALTNDSLNVAVSADGKAKPFSILLEGKCRDPKVRMEEAK